MKKNENKMKKFEVHNKVNIKILEKKPQNGGTPAIENKATMSIFEKKLFEPKSLNDWVVLISKLLNWNNVKNIINRDKLYINI